MKIKIHPEYHSKALVTCSCGNTFTFGSTLPELRVEFCSKCHPAYSGVKKFMDTAKRIEKFKDRLSKMKTAKKK